MPDLSLRAAPFVRPLPPFAMRSTALSALTLAIPFGALAQEDPILLDDVFISSASGVETTLQDAPASVTVIDASVIAEQGARDLTDVIRTVPGLNIARGNSGNSNISFRGLSSSRTLVLVDGRRIGSSNAMVRDYQGDLSNIPLDAIERIEVVRGPMSTLYGSDAMGGVINIILKEPTQVWSGSVTVETVRAEDSTTADSDQISGFISGKLTETLSLSAWVKRSYQDAPEPFTYTDADGAAATQSGGNGSDVKEAGARLVWALNATNDLGLEVTQSEERYRQTYDEHSTDKLEKTSVALSHDWHLGSGHLSSYLRFEDTNNQGWDDTLDVWGKAVEYNQTSFETRYSNELDLANRALEYTLGFSVEREELTDTTTNRDASLIEGDVLTLAGYAEARYDLTDALRLTFGARVDDHEDYGAHVTPRIYANYDFGNGLVLKAGYAQAFVAPDLRSLSPNYTLSSRGNGCKPYPGPCVINGNPDLEPETSDNYEIGLNFQGTVLSWEVTAFYNDVTNMLGARRTGALSDSGYPLYERTNIDEGKTAGIEGGLSWDVTEAVTLRNSFTWIALSEFKYDSLDEPFPMTTTPEWNVTTGLDWRATDALTLSGTATYVGKQAGYITEDGLASDEAAAVPAGQNSSGYVLFDVAVSYDMTENATLNFGVDNLFDEQPDDAVSYREDGRLFRAGLTYSF